MQLVDDSAIHFEIPARDALGKEAVQGKLRGTQEVLFFYWRMKDRTFRRSSEDMRTVEIPYLDIELLQYKATLGVFRPRLVLQIANPKLLADVPGVDVGHATLVLAKGSKSAALQLMKLVEFKRTEEQYKRSVDRLSELDGELARRKNPAAQEDKTP